MMKVLIVDDHKIMRECLQGSLEAAGFQVIGAAANGREAVEFAPRLAPDVVIMDITMPELNGIEATRHLLHKWPSVQVIGLSVRTDKSSILAMFAAGAAGYLAKPTASIAELVLAIETVAAGQKYLSPGIAAILANTSELRRSVSRQGASRVGPRPLSAREREVLQLIAEGSSSKEIATRLRLAVPTVETHRRQLMDKLGLRSVASLTKYAVREGLSPLE